MRVVLSGGGTGGHVFPLIALASWLKRMNISGLSMIYLGQRNSLEEKEAAKIGLRFVRLVRQSNRRDPLGMILSLFLAFLGAIQTIFLFLSFKPDVVIGGGGFVSLPAIVAARILNRPYVLLEQNMVPGKMTRFFSRWAEMTFLTFPGSEKYVRGKSMVVGNPIREELFLSREKARGLLNIPEDAFLILVAGGSKGARSLNNYLLEILPSLLLHSNLMVYWVTGEANFEEIRRRISPGMERLILQAFDPQLPFWISACDLYVGRAGAGLLWEVLTSGVPSIIVPYPFSADNHQMANAKFLEACGASVVVSEDDMGALKPAIEGLIASPEKLGKMRECASKVSRKDASQKIAFFLLERWGK
ncbi:MAG: UDP-N-acetylglucosamine--N-acetylmuramyl-(pentapeptide) pyrophosphoryl-undecaprenol N-acetylglucosamine transferase [bacterium]